MIDLMAIEKELCEAIDKKVADGARVIRHGGGDGRTCGCALSLWAGVNPGYKMAAQQHFGWNWYEVDAFIDGFDNWEEYQFTSVAKIYGDLAALGRRLAAKYVDGVTS